MNGSHFYLYINQQSVDQIIDTDITTGQIAFDAAGNSSVDAAFNNVKVWQLS